MIKQIGDNIISSLGFTSQENYAAVKAGCSGVAHYAHSLKLPEPFMASLIDEERLESCFSAICPNKNTYTRLEKAAILSVTDAAKTAQIDLSDPRVLFVLATTKGNVHLLDAEEAETHYDAVCLWYSAQRIAGYFGNRNVPLVVSNACISGACAQIEAARQLAADRYDYAVVTGADMLSKFIISGFQSFKALSSEHCRPFDASRDGLNLGEAAATIIYKRTDTPDGVVLMDGVIRNDANHISGPSRTGEGCFRALQSVVSHLNKDEIAFINAHGTATAYNDRMESVAIARAGLENVPVTGLKGYFGHTLGAAGVLECVISARALADNTVLPTLGFRTKDADSPLQLSDRISYTDKPYFVKTLSGFGGCNAALLFCLPQKSPEREKDCSQSYKCTSRALSPLYIQAHCRIANGRASLNGQPVRIETDAENGKFLTALYRSLKIDYPKFFKMDHLSKLGFLASELIFDGNASRFTQPKEKEMAVVCFNRTASLDTDSAYQATIQHTDDYFPSPSVFVYTLPNIVTAEIAIRNKIHGETSFYVSEFFDAERLIATVNSVFRSDDVAYALAAWVEYAETDYETMMFLVSAIPQQMPFNADTVNRLYNKPIKK